MTFRHFRVQALRLLYPYSKIAMAVLVTLFTITSFFSEAPLAVKKGFNSFNSNRVVSVDHHSGGIINLQLFFFNLSFSSLSMTFSTSSATRLIEVLGVSAVTISASVPSSSPLLGTTCFFRLGRWLRWSGNWKVFPSFQANRDGPAAFPLGKCQLHTLELQFGVKFSCL